MCTSLLQLYKTASFPPSYCLQPTLLGEFEGAFLLFLPEELISMNVFVCARDVHPPSGL